MRLPGLVVLGKRSDFLAAQRGRRIQTPGFTLEIRVRGPQETEGIRVGFTCSKKVGNAVARNRAKRRLREIARLTLPDRGVEGSDYVLVGHKGATEHREFALLLQDLERALEKAHKP